MDKKLCHFINIVISFYTNNLNKVIFSALFILILFLFHRLPFHTTVCRTHPTHFLGVLMMLKVGMSMATEKQEGMANQVQPLRDKNTTPKVNIMSNCPTAECKQ